MKPSKKLMRDFAKVVLPDYEADALFDSVVWDKTSKYDLSDLQTVIELASKWSEDGLVMQKLVNGNWRVFVGFHPIDIGKFDDKHLPTAIMKAVVEANK